MGAPSPSPPGNRSYDDSNLAPIQFLTEVYRARHLPMVTRIRAADELLKILYRVNPSIFEPRSFTIHIPPLTPAVTNATPDPTPDPLAEDPFPHIPALYKDLLYLKKCYEEGIEDPNLDHMEVKGHG